LLLFVINPGSKSFLLFGHYSGGTPDGSFGNNGVVTTAIGTRSDDGYAVTVQADGKIVVADNTYFTGSKVGVVLRYLGDSVSR
jgi:hypothetical protein